MKTLLACLALATSFSASAITCSGTLQGEPLFVDFRGGVLTIGGDTIATFDNDDVNINFIRGTMRVQNEQGSVTARLTSLRSKTGLITTMVIPARGINVSNVPIRCN